MTEPPKKNPPIKVEWLIAAGILASIIALAASQKLDRTSAPWLVGLMLIGFAIAAAWGRRSPYSRAAAEFGRQEVEQIRLALERRLHSLEQLTPRGFEFAIGRLFEAQGWTVEVTRATADGGKDLVLKNGVQMQIVEVKQWARDRKVGRPLVMNLHAAVMHERADRGIFVTTSDFSMPALEYAEAHDISLIGGSDLGNLMISVFPDVPSPSHQRAMCEKCEKCGHIVQFESFQDLFEKAQNKIRFLANAIADAVWSDQNPRVLLGELRDVNISDFQRAWRRVQEKMPGLNLKDFDPTRPQPLPQFFAETNIASQNCPNGHPVYKPKRLYSGVPSRPPCPKCGTEMKNITSQLKLKWVFCCLDCKCTFRFVRGEFISMQ